MLARSHAQGTETERSVHAPGPQQMIRGPGNLKDPHKTTQHASQISHSPASSGSHRSHTPIDMVQSPLPSKPSPGNHGRSTPRKAQLRAAASACRCERPMGCSVEPLAAHLSRLAMPWPVVALRGAVTAYAAPMASLSMADWPAGRPAGACSVMILCICDDWLLRLGEPERCGYEAAPSCDSFHWSRFMVLLLAIESAMAERRLPDPIASVWFAPVMMSPCALRALASLSMAASRFLEGR
mmetsp:Transcript_40769/g.100178  ORF Transcript_40769/g.100178 Transcript_40769/m.100178 type:complete len:240 (+) Transcript_40769:53-772(+)